MYVEKIEIPAFRVLRNVVLDFSGGYEPQIFPIGSENGGGKSTLLQLVFALLHCSAEPKRHEYLKNLLESDFHAGEDDERLLARLTVRIPGEWYALELVALHDRFLERKLEEAPQLGFESWATLIPVLESIRTAEAQLEHHRDDPRTPRFQRKFECTPPPSGTARSVPPRTMW